MFMSHSNLLEPVILKRLPEDLDGSTILDLACGFGLWTFKILTRKEGNPTFTGIDIWKPYLRKVKKVGLYQYLIKADLQTGLPFQSKTFSYVLCCEVLEHLPSKALGAKLLKEAERVAKNKVIVSVPLGIYPQDEIHGNPYEKHKSIWWPEDLKKHGYNITINECIVLPRTLKWVDRVRRKVFGLPDSTRLMICDKKLF
jgi:ubiquinone/menaquinone biosynthesis C-methylase UbiE